jgi:molybdate transport system ATP-binding protein
MSLSVTISHQLSDFHLDAQFEAKGPLTALFGASGSGKSTLVNVIAGLVHPASARIIVDGETLIDTSRKVFQPAHRRRVGYVFQDARLFPHLSVFQNLRYGKWFAPQQQRYANEDNIIGLLGIEPLLSRKPTQLSGGEKQRVAIGLACLAAPVADGRAIGIARFGTKGRDHALHRAASR